MQQPSISGIAFSSTNVVSKKHIFTFVEPQFSLRIEHLIFWKRLDSIQQITNHSHLIFIRTEITYIKEGFHLPFRYSDPALLTQGSCSVNMTFSKNETLLNSLKSRNNAN